MSERNSSVEYRPIPGFHGYEVGDDGSVWSYRIRNGGVRNTPNKLRQYTERGQRGPRYFRAPYKRVSLTVNRRQVLIHVHKLVLLAFRGPCPSGMESRHLDSNPSNNRLANLVWGTKEENGSDRRQLGRSRGSRNGRAKLTEQQVAEILQRYSRGETQYQLADAFGVSQSLLSLITRREAWRHVPDQELTTTPPSA